LPPHIVETKAGHFKPRSFEDHYEGALKDLIKRKQAGKTIEPVKEPSPTNVVNLMDALRKSLGQEAGGHRRKAAAPSATRRRGRSKRAPAHRRRKAG